MEPLWPAGRCQRAFTRFGNNPVGPDSGHALLSFRSKISWVCVTMAASLPSPRAMRVSSTMVVRPRCSGMQTACAVSPFGTPAKKLVLLSMVAVRPPPGRLTPAVIPPSISPKAITAPPWSTPRRLHNSARTGSSASVRSGERWRTFTPRSLANAGRSGTAMVVPLLRSCAHSMARARRQPDAPSAIFSNARIDSRGRGGRMPFVARRLTRDHGMDARVAVRSSSGIQTRSSLERPPALVAQLDRAPDFESGGRGFESLRARHEINGLSVRGVRTTMPRANGGLTRQCRRALELLAGSPTGCTEALLFAYGITVEILIELINAGLA